MTTDASSSEKGKFRAAVLAFCQLLYEIGDDHVKAATYVFENTHCFMEHDAYKRISLDEFVHGRKLKSGERFMHGCHIDDRANANRALLWLKDKNKMDIKTDERDKGRKSRWYRLTLPSLDTVVTSDYTEAPTQPLSVVTNDYRGPQKNGGTVVTNDYSDRSLVTTQSSHQRLLDQSKYPSKFSEKVPSYKEAEETKVQALQTTKLDVIEIKKEKEEERRMRPVSPELESLWSLVCSEMRQDKEIVTPATFDNWLAPLKVAGSEGAVLYLYGKSSEYARQFQARFARQASAILSRLIHEEAEVRCLPPMRSSA